MMAKKHRSGQGFTLIELLLFMAIFSVIILVLTDLFSSILNIKKESESASAVQQDSTYILSRFMYDIPRSNAVTTPATLGGSGSSLQLVIGGINYLYDVSGGNLTLTYSGNTYTLNSSETSVSNVTFTRIGNGSGKDSITLTFTVTSNIVQQSGQESKTITTTIGLQ